MDLISRIALGIATLFGTMCSKQASDEFKAWTPWIVDRLIQHAASALNQSGDSRRAWNMRVWATCPRPCLLC